MKKLIISIIVFTCIITYTQDSEGTNTRVEEYMNLLKTYSQNIKATQEDFKGKLSPEILDTLSTRHIISLKVKERIDLLSDEETINIAKLKAEAYEEAPFELERLKTKNSYEIKKSHKEGKAANEIRIVSTESLLNQRIKKTLPNLMAKILDIPYIFKATILTSDLSVVALEGNGNFPDLFMTKITINAVVNEILKGEKKYQSGDGFEFYFYQSWNNSGQQLIEGETYLISLLARKDSKGNNILSLVFYSESKNAIFHIENDILQDVENYFGLGAHVNWDSFKSEFQSKYIIKSKL